MKSKKELGQEKLRTWEEKLQCPLCQSDMKVIEEQLVCRNYHTFDLAKQGYVNLFPEHQEENYSQTLFEARYHLMNLRNFYKGLHEQLYLLLQENNLLAPSQFIIDLGTGEGTHLDLLQKNFAETNAIGLDIAKEGIQTAAKHYTSSLWFVGDLANIPLKDHTLNGALTILTPSNYRELKRVLAPDAWVIKIIPGKDYLKELREIVLPPEQVLHHPIASIEKFGSNFDLIEKGSFLRVHTLTGVDNEKLLQMTPLTWNASEEERSEIQKLKHVTIDLRILVGQNNQF